MDSPVSDHSDPWMTEDKTTDSDFVLVTRPLDSIRLADVWLRKENLPDTAATSQRITKIRMGLGNRGGGTAAVARPSTQDECTLLIDQQSFLRDMLKAFTAKPKVASATAVLSTFSSPDIIGDTTNVSAQAAATAAQAQAKDATKKERDNKKTDSPLSRAQSPTMITEQQWTKIWQQFNADIGREIFCIEGRRFMEADDALVTLTALFKEFEKEWMAYQASVDADNAPTLTRRVSEMVYSFALWPSTTAVNLALGIIRAPVWLIKGMVNSIGNNNINNAHKVIAAQKQSEVDDAEKRNTPPPANDSRPSSAAASAPSTPASKPVAPATAKDAPNDPLLCEGLARFVVLLSQQSVLAFPYELLMHQFGNGMENVYVGEMRPSALPDNATAAEREEAEMACSMKVNVRRHPSVVKEVPIEEETSSNTKADNLQPLPEVSFENPPAEGYACSTNPVAPPIPLPVSHMAVAVASPQSPKTKKVTSAPFVILKVSKEFRVFALEDSEDCTLFHIVSEISLDVTSASDPVSVSWSLKPAPQRPDRPTESKIQHRGLRPEPGSAPAYATDGTAALAAPSHHPLAPSQQEDSPGPAPVVGASRDPAAPVRNCDCLGGSMGYHRRDCLLNIAH